MSLIVFNPTGPVYGPTPPPQPTPADWIAPPDPTVTVAPAVTDANLDHTPLAAKV